MPADLTFGFNPPIKVGCGKLALLFPKIHELCPWGLFDSLDFYFPDILQIISQYVLYINCL